MEVSVFITKNDKSFAQRILKMPQEEGFFHVLPSTSSLGISQGTEATSESWNT